MGFYYRHDSGKIKFLLLNRSTHDHRCPATHNLIKFSRIFEVLLKRSVEVNSLFRRLGCDDSQRQSLDSPEF